VITAQAYDDQLAVTDARKSMIEGANMIALYGPRNGKQGVLRLPQLIDAVRQGVS
jgi:hypothetical protein